MLAHQQVRGGQGQGGEYGVEDQRSPADHVGATSRAVSAAVADALENGTGRAELLEELLGIVGDSKTAAVLYDHAMAAEKIDDLKAMETSLRKLIELRPEHAHAYNALGYTFAERNMRLDDAQALIEKALALAPDDPHIIDSMGWVLYRKGQLDKSLEWLRKAYQVRQE